MDVQAGGRPMHPVTTALLALRPGESMAVRPPDGDETAERRRVISRLRSVRLRTRGRYQTEIVDGVVIVRRMGGA